MRIIYKFYLLSLFLIGISVNVSFSQGIPISSDGDKISNSLVESVLAGYPFNGNANDVSVNGFNGTVNGQTLTSDRFGRPDQAYQFTSTNGGIQTPLVEQPNAISLWFQTTAESGTLLSWGLGTEGVYGYTINVLPSGIEFVYNSGDGIEDGSTFTGVAKAGLNDGNWHHLVIDIDETNEIFTFYIDNENIGTDLIAVDGILWAGINSVGMEIGPAIDGRIDNVFLYVGNIFPSEVNTLYHARGWDVAENSLVLNYDFNNGYVEDLSGYGYNFINVAANSVSDRFNTPGNALGLDGIEQFCETSGVPIYDNISISAWFNTSADFSDGYRSFVDLFGLSALSIGSNNFLEGSLRFGDQDFLILSSDIPVNDGQWHHAVLNYDGSTARLYLDNELIDINSDYNGPLFQTSISTYLNIGFNFESDNIRYFTGEVDDINYYNYGISRAEVIELYTENNWPNTVPIASYPFNGNAYDESGNYLDGSVVGATLTTDRFGNSDKAYNFANNVYITVPYDSIFNIGQNTDLSISGWFKTTSQSGILMAKSSQDTGFWIEIPDDGSNTIEFLVLKDNAGMSVRSTPGFNDGQWHHIVIQSDRDNATKIYIDGIFNAENSKTPSGVVNPDTDGSLFFGGSGGNDDYEGDLDDFKIFKALLSEEEIADLYSRNAWPILGQVQIYIDQSELHEGLQPYFPGSLKMWGNAFDFNESEFQFVLNGAADRPYGDSDNDGFIDLLGDPISPLNGLSFVKLADETRAYSVEAINSVGFLGSARTGDETGWQNPDTDMEYIGDGIYELKNVVLFDGFWKIRANDDWNFANWGYYPENPGELFLFADDIPISAGKYDISVDVINRTYTVTEIKPEGGLQATYLFNGNYNDESGNGNHGTGVNAGFGKDRYDMSNRAAAFNGLSSYISIPNDSAFNFGTSEDIYISGWFRTINGGVLFDKSNMLSGYFAQIDENGKLDFFIAEEGIGSGQILTNNSYNDGDWHHYIIQIDRDLGMEIFIDGELESMNEIVTNDINPDTDEDFLIGVAGGVDNTGLVGFFEGLQDDIRIFKQTVKFADQPQAQPTDFNVISKTESAAELSFTQSDASGYLVVRFTESNAFFTPADGITYNTGDQFGNATITYVGADNSWNESALLAETIYNFKIFAFNGEGNQINYLQTSPLSEQITTLTSPPNSQATDFSVNNQSFTSYTISFNTDFDDADGYLVIRKEGDTPPNSAPVGGTNYVVGEEIIEGEKVVAIGTNNQLEETDLAVDTYSYAIYSYRGENEFINYNTVNPLTGTASVLVDNTAPIIQNLQFNEEVGLGDVLSISVSVVDAESGVDEVEIQYVIPGSNSVNTPTIAEMNQSGEDYTYEISDITEAGVEFRIVARNVLGLEAVSTASSVTTVYSGDGIQIPFSSFGTQQSNYRIISVPIDLNSNTINDVFGEELGDYGDKTQWRMFRYSGESTTELSGTSSLIPGRGYWLIVSDNKGFSFFTGAGKNVDASVEEPYEIVLSPGWNQIGNPYPYDVAWSDVEELNDEELQLRVFNGSFTNGNTLPAFSGGFVNWSGSSNFTLQIPKIPVGANPNRQLKDGEGWELNLTLEKDGLVNTLSGIGMHNNAKDVLDSKDEFNLPRFLDYIDLKHNIMANGYYVAKNVVAMHKEFQWAFDIESNLLIEGMNIQWELPKSENFNSMNELMLWDPSSSKLIDMKNTNQYQLRNSDGKKMKIIYGSSDYINELIEVSTLHVSDPYPNPTSGILNIQLFVPEDEADSELLLELIDLKGSLVNTNKVKLNNSGQQTVEWNVTETSVGNLSGVYMLRISSSKNSINKKIVLK
jgi:hypothetical protein